MRLRFGSMVIALVLACGNPLTATTASPETTTSPAPSQATGDWPAYQHDGARSGVGPAAPGFQGVKEAWARTVDQEVFAQPLFVKGRVIVATENNTVYSLDAATGAVTWQTHFGDPVPRSAGLPCGTIDPTGITATPVVDTAAGTIYAVAYLLGFHHELYALDLALGTVRWHLTIDPPRVLVKVHQQRSALTLAGGKVYVAFGGLNGDCGQYTGWVMGVSANGKGTPFGYQVPTSREGGIWATGGATQDADGNLYYAIGNTASTTSFDYGNAVLRLTPDLKVADYWAPKDWASLSRADADIGSISPITLPGGLLFQSGKAGVGYLLRARALGGIGGEVFSAPICRGGAFGAPAFHAGVIYVACGGGISALKLGTDRFDVAWKANGTWTPIVAYGSIWTLAGSDSATLLQLDPATGAVRSRTSVGATNHFCAPSAAAGRLYVPAGTRIVALSPAT